jgi:NAD(P)-dependent dehydrogenase (short-subunit alcohol dehydrogenase family)
MTTPTNSPIGAPLGALTAPPTAIITGAGSGIGRATAITLAREGFSLLLAGRSEAKLIATIDACIAERLRASMAGHKPAHAASAETAPNFAPRFAPFAADLSSPEANQRLIDAALDQFQRLDALINNAAVAAVIPIADSTPDFLLETFRTNALGPAAAIHAAWPHLVNSAKAGGRPCIVNVSTIGTVDPFPGFFAYASSKAALNLMTQSCATEGAKLPSSGSIRAFGIAPGAVETPLLRSAFDVQTLPPERALPPAHVAEVIVACVLGKHDAHNGRVLPVLHESAHEWYREWVRDHPPLPPK